MHVFNPDEALALARSHQAATGFSPLADDPFLLLDASAALPVDDANELAAWLRCLPCPVIAVGPANEAGGWVAACDVWVDDPGAVEPLVEKIKHCPTAATVLVQVLRITENMPVEDALEVESLAYATLQGGAEYQRWLAANRADTPFAATDAGPAVVLERSGDEVCVTLNRASNRNAMSVEMRDALNEALQMVLLDDTVTALSISGNGRWFSTGGDLTEFGTVPDPAQGHIIRNLSVPGRLLHRCAQRLGEHAEARLHGGCIGSGMEFPAFAGRVVAAGNTHFQLPEVGIGLIPGAGGCISVARRIGRQRTAWLALSGKRIRAQQALQWGLVDRLDN